MDDSVWYVVQTRVAHERKVFEALRDMGLHVFCACKAGNPSNCEGVEPLFPCYLLVLQPTAFEPSELNYVLAVGGVRRILKAKIRATSADFVAFALKCQTVTHPTDRIAQLLVWLSNKSSASFSNFMCTQSTTSSAG